MSLDLRARVRDILATSADADPTAITEAVMATLRPAEMRAALEQTLRTFVRQVITEQRTPSSPAAPTPIRQSAKVSAIRESWKARLRDRYQGVDSWKFLADMNYDDLMAAASQRRNMADRNAAWADQLQTWATLVHQYDVQTFGELPDGEIQTALRSAA